MSEKRVERLSQISSDIAQVSLASIVVPFLFDKFNLAMLILGIFVSLLFWSVSITLAK